MAGAGDSAAGSVPGDVVNLSAGDMIPGDVRLLATRTLRQPGSVTASRCGREVSRSRAAGLELAVRLKNIASWDELQSGTAPGGGGDGSQHVFGAWLADHGGRPPTSFDAAESLHLLMIQLMAVMSAGILINGFTKHDWKSPSSLRWRAVGLTPEMLP